MENLRALQRGRARHPPRGLQERRPAAGARLGVLLLRLRPQRRRPLLRVAPHRPAGLALRRHQEGRRGDHPLVQPHLRPLRHRPPLLHRVRALGPPRHGLLLLHPQHPILQGKPITVYRGKDHVDLARDFTYIDDIVKGCLASLDTAGKSTGTGGKKRGPAPYRIFNLGNTSPVTVPTLVSILEKHLRVKAKKHVVEMPGNGDVPFTHANISLARQQLGYKPATNLDAGLKKFVKWYLSYYGYTRGSKSL